MSLDGQLEVDLHFYTSRELNNVGNADNLQQKQKKKGSPSQSSQL